MFCSHCGKEVLDAPRFCPYCGTRILYGEPSAANAGAGTAGAEPKTINAGAPADETSVAETPADEAIALGFSDRANHPEILAAVKKNRKASKIFMLFLVPLPLIGFVAYSLFSGNMELSKALLYGGIVSAVFLIFALIGLATGRAEKSYDAVVVKKSTGQVYRSGSGGSDAITEYRTTVRTDAGKTKTITEREGSRIVAYHYLNEGDRFRYHPQFVFPYELYDKSKATCIYCVGCGTKNPLGSDRCKKCGIPLLK